MFPTYRDRFRRGHIALSGPSPATRLSSHVLRWRRIIDGESGRPAHGTVRAWKIRDKDESLALETNGAL